MRRGPVAGILLVALLVGGCGSEQPAQPTLVGGGKGPPWFGAHGEPVDVLRWQPPGVCGVGHASTQLWVAPWDYGEVELPAGEFNVSGPYEIGRPPPPARKTPLWSAAGRLWVLPGDESVVFLVRDDGAYKTLRAPVLVGPNGPCTLP